MATILPPYINADITELSEYLFNAFAGQNNQAVNKQTVINWLNTYIVNHQEIFVTLNSARPDFEAFKQQFQASLRTKTSWQDVLQAGGGETLLEFICAMGEFNAKGLITSLQEVASYDTAVLTSSVYTKARAQGVHISRGVPAEVNVTLKQSLGGVVSIPHLSQFLIDTVPFFNRETIIFNNVTNVDAVLYQGQIQKESFVSSGQPYQFFEIGDGTYSIADADLYCFMSDGTEWEKSR